MKYLTLLIVMFALSGCIQLQNQPNTTEQRLTETNNSELSEKPMLCFEENCFKYKEALTAEEQRTGLMFRESLPQDEGLLFPFFSPSTPGFWMKNVNFPIDIIWLNEKYEIVDISKNLPPCSQEPCRVYKSFKEANFAFEINAGLSDEFELVQGKKAIKK